MMNMEQACGVIASQRPLGSLVVVTMSAMHAFDRIDSTANDTTPSSRNAVLRVTRMSSVPLMGGAAGLGLGLALAQPDRQVIVVDGDASLLLELSGLVTVSSAQPDKLIHVLVKNGTQFNGLANLQAPGPGFNFSEAARNAGYRSAQSIEDSEQWAEVFSRLLEIPGPHFVELTVAPLPQRTEDGFAQTEMPDRQFTRMGHEAEAIRKHLQGETT